MLKRKELARKMKRPVKEKKIRNSENGSSKASKKPIKDWANVIRQKLAEADKSAIGKSPIICIECTDIDDNVIFGFQTRARIMARRGNGGFSFDKGDHIVLENGLPTDLKDSSRLINIDKSRIASVEVT